MEKYRSKMAVERFTPDTWLSEIALANSMEEELKYSNPKGAAYASPIEFDTYNRIWDMRREFSECIANGSTVDFKRY